MARSASCPDAAAAGPTLLVAVVMLFHIPYQDYMAESHWLLWLLGPATVAFAVPVYENRQLIRRHWLSLSVGVVASVVMAVGSTVLLARWLDLSDMLQRSLAMRSITTPLRWKRPAPSAVKPISPPCSWC